MAACGVGATGPESSTREILPGWISVRWNDRAPAASTRVLEGIARTRVQHECWNAGDIAVLSYVTGPKGLNIKLQDDLRVIY